MPIVDSNGVEWSNLREMCMGYGFPYKTAQARIDAGMTLEQALDKNMTPEEEAEHKRRVDEAAAIYGDKDAEAESQSIEAALRTMKPGQKLKDRFKGQAVDVTGIED